MMIQMMIQMMTTGTTGTKIKSMSKLSHE
jgi:hypothetical protein